MMGSNEKEGCRVQDRMAQSGQRVSCCSSSNPHRVKPSEGASSMRQRLLLAVALLASTALALPVAADPPAVDNRSSSSPAHQTPVPAVLSSGRVEPSAGSWRTWVIPSGKQYRLPPP